MLVKGTIKAAANNGDKEVIFKNCAPFTDCISKINNTQVDNAKDIDVVMPLHNLIEYSDNYSKTSGSLWQYCRDKPAVYYNGVTIPFNASNFTDSLNFKEKITGQTDDNCIKDVEIIVRLKSFSNFWRTIDMPLIHSKLILF